MKNVLCKLYAGEAVADLSGVAAFIYELGPGGARGLAREQEGIEEVLGELTANFSTYGAEAGVAQVVVDRVMLSTSRIQQIRAMRVIVDRMAGALKDSEAMHEHDREADIGIIAASVSKAAQRKDASLMAPFEKTVLYHRQAALRAAKTRRKNAEAEAAASEAEAQPG